MSLSNALFLPLTTGLTLASTELQAMGLDGDVVALSDGYTYADTPASAAVKALIVTLSNTSRYAPCGQSALWVFGLTSAPRILSVVLIGGIRANHETLDRRRVRELRHIQLQLVHEGTALVQSPKWALIDVAKDATLSDREKSKTLRDVCRTNHSLCIEAGAELARRRIRPNAMTGLRALALAHAIDIVDGINSSDGIQNALQVHGIAHLENKAAQSQPGICGVDRGGENVDVMLR